MREALAATLYDNFLSNFPAHFDTKFVTAGGTVPKLRNIVYIHVGPKMAPKCELLKLISFWFIVLQKVSATNFGEKNNKNKRSKKTKKYIRNSQNNKIHKKLILIPEYFSSTIAKNATKSI